MKNLFSNFFPIEEISKISNEIVSCAKLYKSSIITFEGPLGAGKTTLIKEISRDLGYKSEVTSPTFQIINEYSINNKKIFHLDLYRIQHHEELLEIGIDDIIHNHYFVLIEWPSLVFDFINHKNFIKIILSPSKKDFNQRLISVQIHKN